MKYLASVTILLAALAQMAATGEPQTMSFDKALELLKTYDYGQSDKALHFVELHVVRYATDAAHKAEAARRLAAILAEPKTPQATKVFICQQLLVVGTEAQVPLLAKMLDDPQTAEIARYTLEAIPGEASLAAIRGAVDRLAGMPLVGAVNSLGIRRDGKSIPALSRLLGNGDAQVVAAAAESLGKIATAEAAAALLKVEIPTKAASALHNARLQCAERLAAAGDAATPARIYELLWSSQRLAAWRVAALSGLAKVAAEKAAPLVLEALGAEDPLLQAAAVRLSARLPGRQVTAALIGRLEKLDAAGQALLLDVLAERGDRSAVLAASKRMQHKSEAVRVAAVRAMGKLGDVAAVEPLARLAAASGGAVQQAARASLARLSGAGIEPKLLAVVGEGAAAVRVEAIRALAARRSKIAAGTLLKAAGDANPPVRTAAWDALGVVADRDSLGKMVQLLAGAGGGADAESAERAVLMAGKRIEDLAERSAAVVAALAASPAAAKPSLLGVLSGLGGPQALQAVRARLSDSNVAVREAAVRALVNWPDVSAAEDLLSIAQTSDNTACKLQAVRGYLRLVGELKDAAERLKMLERIRPIAKTTASKRMLLAGLQEVADAGALHVVASFLTDADVRPEAEAATLKVGRALLRVDRPAVREAMQRLLEATKDQAVAGQATALDEEASKAPSPGAGSQALQYDKKRSDAQKAWLGKRAPKGYRLACYLDCGPDEADGEKGGPRLRLVNGIAYCWPDADRTADARFGSVAYDGQRVVFEATGLNPKKSYQIGFTWWDFDHDTREQSVWLATGNGQRETRIVDKTKLPSAGSNQPPDGKTLPLPPAAIENGSVRIIFRNESQPNAVVCELWLWESAEDGAAPGR
jgi:HEAT repeat protein